MSARNKICSSVVDENVNWSTTPRLVHRALDGLVVPDIANDSIDGCAELVADVVRGFRQNVFATAAYR